MGYQDREYYQEDSSPGGYQLGGDISYTWRIVIVNAAVFLANFFLFASAGDKIVEYGALHGDTLVKPWLWFQFLSYGFVHSPGDLGHIFWNMFGLVMFGAAIEEAYGRREYLRFYLLSILCGGAFWGIRVYLGHYFGWEAFNPADSKTIPLLLGASGGVTAVTLLFCLRYPFAIVKLMFVLPVPAWVLGTIIIIGNVLQASQSVNSVAYDVHLIGAAFAVMYFYFDWNLSRALNFTWLSRATASLGKLVKPRPNLKVYDQEDDDAVYRELESEADRILGKISRDGESSLSEHERKTLERYSRLMRQKHR